MKSARPGVKIPGLALAYKLHSRRRFEWARLHSLRNNSGRADVLKGHGFNRADEDPEKMRALAPEGSSSGLPTGLRPVADSQRQVRGLFFSVALPATAPLR